MKTLKYLISPDGQWSYVKLEENFIPPQGYTVSNTKPTYLTPEIVSIIRDKIMQTSPLVTPLGSIDYDSLSREKLSTANDSLGAFDRLYPSTAPHQISWTMSDNSQVMLGTHEIDIINISAAQRALNIHFAAVRIKTALRTNTLPDPADLAILGIQ